jgi:hypothetical protein
MKSRSAATNTSACKNGVATKTAAPIWILLPSRCAPASKPTIAAAVSVIQTKTPRGTLKSHLLPPSLLTSHGKDTTTRSDTNSATSSTPHRLLAKWCSCSALRLCLAARCFGALTRSSGKLGTTSCATVVFLRHCLYSSAIIDSTTTRRAEGYSTGRPRSRVAPSLPEPQRTLPGRQRLQEDVQPQRQEFPIRVDGENGNLRGSPFR